MRFINLFLIIICLSGLSGFRPGGDSAPDLSASPWDQNRLAPPACDISGVLKAADKLLAGRTFEAHCISLREVFVLALWLVVPELDPRAPEDAVAALSRLAFLEGARACHNLAARIPCVRRLFDALNPMIVDSNYNCWYRDIISLEFLPAEEDPPDEELLQSVSAASSGQTFHRVLPPQIEPETAVAWTDVKGVIDEIIREDRTSRNTAAYPLAYDESYIIEVYWEVPGRNAIEEDAVRGTILRLAKILAAAALPVERLEISITNPEGRLLLYGLLHGSAIRRGGENIRREQIMLEHVF